MAEKQQPDYVTNAAWLRQAGRVDHVDEIADQFERPQPAESFWAARAVREQRVNSWFGSDRLHPDLESRRAS